MSLDAYHEAIAKKRVTFAACGFEPGELHPSLKPHQAHCVDFAIRAGTAALFLDTGLGKTLCALDWARAVTEHTNKPVLMLAPLAVAQQHQREAERFGLDSKAIREPHEIAGARTYITNYDRLAKFDVDQFAGVVLDESSILKSFTGATTRQLIKSFARTPYRLACTATPAPNDHTELGQHADFLGIMESPEMLSRWFLADQTQMGRYRLKRSAVRPFWDWVASWARAIAKPSDIGCSDDGYDLPPLQMTRHVVEADRSVDTGEHLFRIPDMSATSIHKEKRLTKDARADVIADLVNGGAEPWVVWCDTDYEADALAQRIPDAVEVRGSMTAEKKEAGLVAFSTGQARVIITKPSIAGFGLNWQHCAHVAFAGLSFSYESYYQAVRRCWRFGQTRPVNVHVAMADTERAIWDVISRKTDDHDTMKAEMTAAMRRASRQSQVLKDYNPNQPMRIPTWLNSATA
ncbi:MAG: helicase-related protein [Hyphomonadaceae bacterium]